MPSPRAKTQIVNGQRVPIDTTITDVQDTVTESATPSGIDYRFNVATETADQYNTRIAKARETSPTMEESGFITPTLETNSTADIFAKQYQKDATQEVDQDKIRRNYINQFQDQINALNQIYDQQLMKAQKEGVGRVGSGTAILARRGLGGSPRGEAIKEGVLEQNRGIESAIQDERSLAISQIYGQATKLAQTEAAERRAAKEAGATKYLDYLKGQDTRKASNLNSVVQALLAQGVDPETMSADELNAVGKQIGVDGKSLLGSYKVAKYTFDAEQAAKQAEADRQALKDNTRTLSEGQSIVVYNPETGKYDTVASRAKTYAPSTGGGNTPAPGSPEAIDANQKAITNATNILTTVNDAIDAVSPASAGFIGAQSKTIGGTPAYNLARTVETIKANLAFEELAKMRAASKTGGALGSITERELDLLGATVANLDVGQSPEQLRANLEDIRTRYENVQAALQGIELTN